MEHQSTIATKFSVMRTMAKETKVKRSKLDIFENLKEWIESKGGYVHPAVHLCDRTLKVKEAIEQDVLVMTIPCLIDMETIAETDAKWKTRVEILQQLQGLEHPVEDLIIASYLAERPSAVSPYLQSLPADLNKILPRSWADADKFLKGSPLLARLEASRLAIEKDRQLVCDDVWKDLTPSPTNFSAMMAAVTSRAFQGSSGISTMVPLLDLCNHHRGRGSFKNLSYTFGENKVNVTTTCKIEKDEDFRITYGALGNHQLMLNGGFAIPENLEPDESSNDALELSIRGSTVFLRAGPKSYSFSPLVKALELIMEDEHGVPPSGIVADDENRKDPGFDDMEDFLNYCDNEDEQGDGDDDCTVCYDGEMLATADETPATQVDQMELERTEFEVQALTKLRGLLLDLRTGYALDPEDARRILSSADGSHHYHASVLIASEWRTIYFFVKAVDALVAKLDSMSVEATTTASPFLVSPEDERRIKSQVEALVDAFLRIRHPKLT